MQPLVSIIVPIYNVEPYLVQCVESIINQSYTNLEIILVDDGSSDACPQICDSYAQKDSRITVIHKYNGGLSDARNSGLKKCAGEYISFIDSDDWVAPTYIETFINIIRKEGIYDYIVANHTICSPQKNTTGSYKNNKTISGKTNVLLNYCHLCTIPPCAWNKLYSSDFIKKHKLTFKENLLFEDQLWGLQCASYANKIRLIPQELYFYSYRKESIMNSSTIKSTKRIESWSLILSESEKILNAACVPKYEYHFFLQHKIEEALSTSLQNFKFFQKAYLQLQTSLKKNIIFYWRSTATPLKKIIFLLLHIMPSIIFQQYLYRHLIPKTAITGTENKET